MARRPINQTLTHLVAPLIFGGLILMVALCSAASTSWLVLGGTTTNGRVVALARNEFVEDGPDDVQGTVVGYAPIFVFKAADGREFTATAQGGSNPPAYVVGQQVRVLYRNGNPSAARIATFWQLWGATCAFAIAGSVISLAGWGALAWGQSRIRRGLPTTNDEWTQKWAARGWTTRF